MSSTKNTSRKSKNSREKYQYRQSHKDAEKCNKIKVSRKNAGKKDKNCIVPPQENELISLVTQLKIETESQSLDCSDLVFTPSNTVDSELQSKYFNGDLQSHEGGKHKGHTISEHTHTYEELLVLAPKLTKEQATFFPSKLIADNKALEHFVKQNDVIDDFYNDSKIKLKTKKAFDLLDMDPFEGYSVQNGKVEIREFTGTVILINSERRNKTDIYTRSSHRRNSIKNNKRIDFSLVGI